MAQDQSHRPLLVSSEGSVNFPLILTPGPEADNEARAAARHAFHHHRASVALHDVLHDRKPQPVPPSFRERDLSTT